MTKKSICLAFEVHQPFRLRKDFFWTKQMFKRNVKAEDLFDYYFFGDKDREVFEKVARKCYRPTNDIIKSLIEEYDDFKVAYSVSGVFVEQCERFGFGKDILEDFRQLASTNKVEFLDQTYYHSLVGLYEDEREFIEQVRMHRELMRDLIGYEPSFFENTELLYNNRIAKLVEAMGYRGIFAEGVPRILSGRSPNYVYTPIGCKNLKVLLRDYPLTDDIGFRFSLKSWKEYPLNASKYASWLDATQGQCITLFLDYETFGEHHWEDTGIFEFLRDLPSQVSKYEMEFSTPSEILEKYKPIGVIDVRNLETTSWADVEKDTSCFIGNTMQWACYDYLRWLEPYVKESKDDFVKIWRYLGISDHLYYMFTVGGASGEVHSYFSHFEKPYDAFIALFSVIHDFDIRLRAKIKSADYPFIFWDGRKVWSLMGLSEYISGMEQGEEREEIIKEHVERGDFERWIRESVGEEEIAKEVGNLSVSMEKEKYDADVLRERICAIVSKAILPHSNI